jgi:pimeloyl-ACP methyl ester carboxylesterase
MQLYFKKYGTEGKTILILHGLFGMSDNWHNIARKLSETNTAYTLDLRNHGQSPHSPIMNYSVMADDVWDFMNDEKISEAIVIGHSMGGKTAMAFANKYPEKTEKLIVVDIAPKAYKPGHIIYFDAMKSINFKASGRKEIEDQLAKNITNQGEMLFLLKNLYRKENGEYGLKLNLEAIEANYEAIIAEVILDKPKSIPTLFIKGEKSNYIIDADFKAITQNYLNISFATVANAGHWVHAENPEGFLAVVNEFLSQN